jgi:hypothetical protein
MRLIAGIAIALVLVAVLATYGNSASAQRCRSGEAKAFVAIQDDPPYLVGTIPSKFSDDARYFSRRFNCLGQSAAVRRVNLGIYEVRFPDLHPRLALATAISDEGVTASALPIEDGIVRVSLRGPLGGSDVATRRDVPFSIVIY